MKKHTDTLRLYLSERKNLVFPVAEIARLVDAVWNTYLNKGTVYIMGNGGGASTAEHFASDLSIHPFVSEDKRHSIYSPRLKVYSLTESSSMITRLGNDMGYEYIFVSQLADITEIDIVIAFSVSGNSPNILHALRHASRMKAITACIGKGGKANDIVDVSIEFSGTSEFPGQTGTNDNFFHIEDAQLAIAHMITGILKERINGQND